MKEPTPEEEKKETLIEKHDTTKKKLTNLEIEKDNAPSSDVPLRVSVAKPLNIDYYLAANCISKLFYHWAFLIIRLSHKVKICVHHLGVLKGPHSSMNFMDYFYYVYDELGYRNKSLVLTIFRTNIWRVIWVLVLGLTSTGISVGQMIIFKQYVSLFKEGIEKIELYWFLIYGIGFLVTKLINIFISKKIIEHQNYVGFKAGVELNCVIFDKLLKVSPSSRHNKAETGEIVNYVQVDSNQLIRFVTMSPQLLTIPISITAYSILLFYYLGFAFFFGLVVLVIFLILNYVMQKTFKRLQKQRQGNMDKRLRMTTAILFNLKVLKLYAWDNFFLEQLNILREIELSTIKKIFSFRNLNQTLFWLSPVMTTIATIGAYEYLSDDKHVEIIFVSLGVLNSLQEPVRSIAMIYTTLLETLISMKRIETFLKQDDVDDNKVIYNDEKTISDGIAIKIEKGIFSWGAEQKDILNSADNKDRPISLILKDINFSVKKGEFVCVIGEVGSGKSSLLNAILNNMIQVGPKEYKKLLALREKEENEDRKESTIQIVPEGKVSNAIKDDEEKNLNEKNENNENAETDDGENEKDYNKVYVNGSISYVCQTSWIQNNTLKNNIIFFHPFDEEKYNHVLKISELLPDLQILKGGDMTEIGEKGINLSGGQKARVSIARALYSDSDIYLFDDPISALDAHVGRNIMNNCICDYLKDKTRILVTHAIQYCDKADRIVYMKDGKINWEGDFKELSKQDFYKKMMAKKDKKEKDLRSSRSGDISYCDVKDEDIGNEVVENVPTGERKTITEHYQDLKKEVDESSLMIEKDEDEKIIQPLNVEKEKPKNVVEEIENIDKKADNENENEIKTSNENEVPEQNQQIITGNKEKKGEIKRITRDEDRAKGELEGNVYTTYFKNNGGACFVISLLSILIIWQGLKCYSDIYLVNWKNNDSGSDQGIEWLSFGIYSGLGISAAIFVYLRLVVIYWGSIGNSRTIHQSMLSHLVHAPINLYHDTVPKGQIFNRLSNDMFKIDIGESFMFYNVTSYSFNLIGQITVCAIYQPYCLILVPFIVIIGLLVMKYYLNCSRELSRLEGISRSPILNSVNETVAGALTIRAFKLNSFFIKDFRGKADNFLKTRIFLVGIMNWYTLMLDFLSFTFIIFLVVFSIVFRTNYEASVIGILLTYCVQIQDELVRYLTCRSNLENDMVGLERCLAYTRIMSEKPENMEIDKTLENWPTEGGIKFENYSVQYRPDTEIVLKNLSFEIEPKQKIGIVGRTGSGKSTIALCLFRILEAKEGKILIDDTDISQIGLSKLRSNLTIIPQDPTLMEGSLRFNIDPLQKHTDQEIEDIMKEIGFWYICERNLEENKDKPDNEKGLNMIITEDGGNISIGERQLICITRAILRKSRIIIMDEATASIDVNTENIIQKAISNLLSDSTILTIAHRIKTVMNSDKILVLENGEVREFDSPKVLLSNKKSMFYDFYTNLSKNEK